MSDTLAVHQTAIPGLLVVDLPLHGDARGWFKENWQRATMTGLGLPDFGPVQHSVAHNGPRGVTRGFHAEPWDKFVSVVAGRIFGAWVDLREGPTFGEVVSLEVGADRAVFVPRGVGNAYQTLADDTVYSYLVNAHWSRAATASYTYLNLDDPTVGVAWPIPLDEAVRSAADLTHPRLDEVTPMPPRRTVVLGSKGQVGQELLALLPQAVGLDREEIDLTDPRSVAAHDWSGVGTVVNAAAFTAVDQAETEQGRRTCWATNVTGVAALVRAARQHGFTLVHLSSDYVFDGSDPEHPEDEPFSPLGVYGQSKAAGDAVVGTLDRHYIVRTSWVIGQGRNFVSTMVSLAERGICPPVVDDQFGRLTFAADLAAGIVHLLESGAPFGTYNLTNSGPVTSWARIAADVFALCGRDPGDVVPITTAQWTRERLDTAHPVAPRPHHSTLTLDRITTAGFTPPPAHDRLTAWVRGLR